MKKMIFAVIAVAAIAATCFTFVSLRHDSDSFFEANVEALAAGEEVSQVKGHCKKLENACLYICSQCQRQYYYNADGPSYNMSGTCSCGVTVSSNSTGLMY